MDTDAFAFLFTPIKGLFNGLRHISKFLDMSEKDPALEIYSEDKKKLTCKMKLVSSPKVKLDEAILL